MLGGSGFAILLVFTIAAAVTMGVLLLTFLSHYFLVCFEETVAGQDKVAWADEPIFELVWKPVYLLGILAVPVVPVAVILVAFVPALADHPSGPIVVAAAIVWLIFPVLLLSSYYSGSWWSFELTVITRLARHIRAALVFYVLSGVLLAAAGAAAYFTVAGSVAALLIASAVSGIVPLLYGRLLGRLAWILENPLHRKKPKRRRQRPGKTPAAVANSAMADEGETTTKPSDQIVAGAASLHATGLAIPEGPLEEEEDEWARYKKPYAVMTNAEVEIEIMKKPKGDPGVVGPLVDLPPLGMERKPKDDKEERKRQRIRSVKELFFRRVWTFPFYGFNVSKWFNASFLVLVFALLLRVLAFAASALL